MTPRHAGLGLHETAAGSDDEEPRLARRRLSERAAVGHLAAEVEAAQEGEDVGERHAVPLPDALRELEACFLPHHQARSLARARRRREQENPRVVPTREAHGSTALRNASASRALSTSSRVTQPRRAMATPHVKAAMPATECASEEMTNRMPRSRAARTQRGSRSRRRGSP